MRHTFVISLPVDQGCTWECPCPPRSCWPLRWRNYSCVWKDCTCPV